MPTHHLHPGTLIKEDFMEAYGLSMYRLARLVELPDSRVQRVIRGEAAVDADMDRRLCLLFDAPLGYFLDLQAAYDRLTHPVPKQVLAKIGKHHLKLAHAV